MKSQGKKVWCCRMKVVNSSKINERYHTNTQQREFVAGLSSSDLFDMIANEGQTRSKITSEGELEWKTGQE